MPAYGEREGGDDREVVKGSKEKGTETEVEKK